MYAIETHGLTKRFRDQSAIAHLDLAVSHGEAFGFLGPNGAGKSTTIALFLDFLRPDAGTARIDGYDVTDEPLRVRERVGIVPERCGLYPRLTAREHVSFVIAARSGDGSPDDLLERVGLAHAADNRTRTFSTGMAQRLRLAMALAGDPDVLILDEPTTGLDPAGVRLLSEILTTARDAGTTIFFSSHRLEQVAAICDRIGILVDGRLRACEPTTGTVRPILRVTLGAVDEEIVATLTDHDAVTGQPMVRESANQVVIDCGITDDAARTTIKSQLEDHTAVAAVSIDHVSLEDRYHSVVEGVRCA